jgi:hypothetical protein
MRRMPMSVLEKMRLATAKQAERKREPWLGLLENVHGRVGDDGIERVSTQSLFDRLQIPVSRRKLPAQKRLSGVMAQLGWSSTRMRDFSAGGYLEQVRGYCRQAKQRPLRGADTQSRSRTPAEDSR